SYRYIRSTTGLFCVLRDSRCVAYCASIHAFPMKTCAHRAVRDHTESAVRRCRRAGAWAAFALLTELLPAAVNAQALDLAPPTDLWQRPTLLGDWGGLRDILADHG